jgi:tRNA threonylcarbamoyladenosine modification (KEOPS) complex Cgi121 subunit
MQTSSRNYRGKKKVNLAQSGGMIVQGFRLSGMSLKQVLLLARKAEAHLDPPSCVQFCRSDTVAGYRHLAVAGWHAAIAWDHHAAISRTLGLEVLLFASGQRQISKALEILGLSEGCGEMAVVILAPTRLDCMDALEHLADAQTLSEAPEVLGITKGKIKRIARVFGVEMSQIRAPIDLSLERRVLSSVALSTLDRSFHPFSNEEAFLDEESRDR